MEPLWWDWWPYKGTKRGYCRRQHLQAKKSVLTRTCPWWHSDLGLSDSRTMSVCFLTHPVNDICYRSLNWPKTGMKYTLMCYNMDELWKQWKTTDTKGHILHAAAKSFQSCPTLCDPIDGSPPAPPSLGFSRQEHWSGLPFPSPMHESEKWKSCSVVSDS